MQLHDVLMQLRERGGRVSRYLSPWMGIRNTGARALLLTAVAGGGCSGDDQPAAGTRAADAGGDRTSIADAGPACAPDLDDAVQDGPFAAASQTPLFETGLILPEWSLPCVPAGTGVPQTECNHHGSTVAELADGSVGVVWYHGEFEKSKDSRIVWSRRPSGSQTWTTPEVVFDDPGLSEGNAALWMHEDGTLFVFFATIFGDGWNEARVRYVKSTDEGQSWSSAVTLREKYLWNARHRPIRLADGALLLPCYNESLAIPAFFRSSDDFETWEELGDLPLFDHVGQIQPALFTASDGTVVALTRDGTRWSRIQRMTSDDRGSTWTPSVPTELPNPATSIDVVKLANGHVVVVFNNDPDVRRPLSVALSLDDGATFVAARDLPIDCPDCELHYPSITQSQDDGTIWISYTHDRKTIGWARLNEAWLAEGSASAKVTCNAGVGFACASGDCLQSCTSDEDCGEGRVCGGGRCGPPCGDSCCGSCVDGLCEVESIATCVGDK